MNVFRRCSRRDFLQFVGVAAMDVSLGPVLADGFRPNRPNIILIVVDDWAHMDIGIAGHPLLKTPNLDRLVLDGVHFTRA